MSEPRPISLRPLFAAMDSHMEQQLQSNKKANKTDRTTAIDRHMGLNTSANGQTVMNGIRRIQLCRGALDALDRRGWNRSFHQRLFHEEYLKSCARIFFKRDGPGAFAKNHNRVLELNGWDSTPQEILVSTPRRFGKTISVSMFAAAMVFSAPNMELSIYSTCKRISQKLLRNIVKFLDLIYLELGIQPYKILRMNSEVCCLRFLGCRALTHDVAPGSAHRRSRGPRRRSRRQQLSIEDRLSILTPPGNPPSSHTASPTMCTGTPFSRAVAMVFSMHPSGDVPHTTRPSDLATMLCSRLPHFFAMSQNASELSPSFSVPIHTTSIPFSHKRSPVTGS
jgi:hypothetical protein